MMKASRFIGVISLNALLLAGCATYSPLPLAGKLHLASRLPSGVNTTNPLTITDITRLTLLLNPDLQAARNYHDIGQAQIVQASVLPNPQSSASYGFLLSGPANFDSYGLGLSEDIKALIVRGATRESAEYEALKVDADLLWQEWQTVSKAQLDYVDLVEMQKQHKLLEQNHQLFADRYAKSHAAMLRGDVDLTVTAPDLTALTDAEKQLADFDRQMKSKWQELDALLGLEPSVRFPLSNDITLAPIDTAKIRDALPHLAEKRPDLLALQYGYQAQEQKLRGAILGQFPALVFGGTYGPDTSHVFSGGPTVSLDLPIFNRNQGNIAIETATRQKLHDEYTNRLDAADGEVEAMLASHDLLKKQYDDIHRNSGATHAIGIHADNAFRAGNIDERAYIDLKSAQLSQEQQALTLEQSLLEQQVALATLLGIGMPSIKLADTSGE